MDSDKIERLRERLLQCAVCMDEYKDPRILPCHHTLCFDCIANVVQSSSASGRFFRCPQCRSDVCVPRGGIEDLPINFYIISLQDELGCKGYSGTCDVCERDWLVSQFRCIDCDMDICRFCIHAHRLETHAEAPKIIRIETSTSSTQMASTRACSDHADEILQMYCTTCSQAICVTCSCDSHKRHSVVPLNVKLQESKTYLQAELDRLTSEKRKVLKTAGNLEKFKEEVMKVSNRSLLEVDAAAHRTCELIMKKKSEIEKEILVLENQQKEDIESATKDFKSYLQRIERGLAFLLDLQDNDICLEVVDTYKEFSSQLKASRKAVTTNHIRIQESHFAPSLYGHVSDVNLGVCRKLYHHGKLGTLSSKKFCLSIDPKTLEVQKQLRGLPKLIENVIFKRLVQFFIAFLVFQIIFYVGDATGFFDIMIELLGSIYFQAVAVFVTDSSEESDEKVLKYS